MNTIANIRDLTIYLKLPLKSKISIEKKKHKNGKFLREVGSKYETEQDLVD